MSRHTPVHQDDPGKGPYLHPGEKLRMAIAAAWMGLFSKLGPLQRPAAIFSGFLLLGIATTGAQNAITQLPPAVRARQSVDNVISLFDVPEDQRRHTPIIEFGRGDPTAVPQGPEGTHSTLCIGLELPFFKGCN